MKWTHLHQVTSLWAIKQENYPLLFESILGVNVSKFPAVKSKGLYSIAIHFITYLLGIPPKDSSVFQPFFSLRIRWDDPSRFLFQSRNGRCFHQICRARMFMTSLTLTNSQGTLAFFGEWWGPEKNGPGSIFERRCPITRPKIFWVCMHQIPRAYYYRMIFKLRSCKLTWVIFYGYVCNCYRRVPIFEGHPFKTPLCVVCFRKTLGFSSLEIIKEPWLSFFRGYETWCKYGKFERISLKSSVVFGLVSYKRPL